MTPAAQDDARSCGGVPVPPDDFTIAPCPGRPNCVEGRLDVGALGADAAWSALKAALLAEPRSRIEQERGHALVATFRSRLFNFVDEARFALEPGGTIHYRSAACSGYYDFGVNRRRVARIAARLADAVAGQDRPR